VTYSSWPQHVHAFKGVVDYKLCAKLTRNQLRTSEQRAAFEAEDKALLLKERELMATLPGRSA
jgi:hypothetical protein